MKTTEWILTLSLLTILTGVPASQPWAQSKAPVENLSAAKGENADKADKKKDEEDEEEVIIPPTEPVYPPVRHVVFDWPVDLHARIEALLHGLSMDMPPEYDYYGYEIRRYMVSVCNINVLASKDNIKGQLINIENAENVLRNWRKDLNRRMAQIEQQMDEEGAEPDDRVLYRYNKGKVSAFFAETESWIRNNKALLQYLHRLGKDNYKIKGSKFSFRNEADLEKFVSLYDARERALQQMRKYTPFKLMIY